MNYTARRVVLLVVTVAMLAYIATHLSIGTDITHFMPDRSDAKLAALSRRFANSDLTRTMMISVGADDPAVADAAAAELEAALDAHPEVEWTRSGVPDDIFEEAQSLYFPRRYYFASDRPESELAAMLADDGLRERADRLLRELRQPTSAFLKPLMMDDPLGLFRDFVDRLRRSQPQPPTRGGRLVSPDGRYALIVLATRSSPFASGAQAPFLEDLKAEIAALQERHGGALTIEMSGANRIAVQAEESIRRDVSQIVAFTFVGIAGLFFLLFRSLLPFLLAVVPAIVGMMAGVTVGLMLLGNLDGLSIAFAASLLGVTVDHAIHIINHHNMLHEKSAADAVRHLAPSLVMSGAAAMASFAGLMFASSRAFRELGIVSTAGIGAALVAAMYFLPALLSDRRRRMPAASLRLAAVLQRGIDVMSGRRKFLFVFTLAALAAGLAGLPRLNWVDDLSRLGNVDPELLREEARVRSRLPLFEAGRFIITLAPTEAEALRRNDALYDRLRELQDNGTVAGIRSLHQFLWSEDLQRRNLETLRAAQPATRVDRVFHEAGFRSRAFEKAFDDLADPPPPLTLDDLRRSALGDLLSSTVMELGDEVAILTQVRGAESFAALEKALADLEGVIVFDQKEFANQIYGEFQATALNQILVGIPLMALVLLIRYRAWRPALAASLPSVVVVLVLLGGFAFFGVETNLLHAIALMMVMGMSADYGVFLVDTSDEPEAFAATMLSLLLACMTTVFVFGALAISEHPALRALGLTTGCGVLLGFVFAPVSLLLTDVRRAR